MREFGKKKCKKINKYNMNKRWNQINYQKHLQNRDIKLEKWKLKKKKRLKNLMK